jgi:hypothetical protein
MSGDFTQTCIRELHEYTRQIFTSTVAWFTFFITVNYASMGWFASTKEQTASTSHAAIKWVSYLFILQDFLGIVVCVVIAIHFWHTNRRILLLHQQLTKLADAPVDANAMPGQTSMPLWFYTNCMILMVVTLISILVAWLILPSKL